MAPAGLGGNVRRDLLDTAALRQLDTPDNKVAAAADDGWYGCPGGITTNDYYCFYQYRDFGGRRVQFTGVTDQDEAANWGFNNGTSAWVSRDVDCTVVAYDGVYNTSLWDEPQNSRSSFVGSANDNRLSSWTCH